MTGGPHRSADCPVFAVVCTDPAHNGARFVVARFGTPPAGTWMGFGPVDGTHWLPMPPLLDPDVDRDKQRLRRLEDLVSPGGDRYNLECAQCAPHRGRRKTVPIRQESLDVVLDALAAAGRSEVSLSALASTMSRSEFR